jgi:hypothetical protein
LQFNFYGEDTFWELFYKDYRGFYNEIFNENVSMDLDISSGGIFFEYILLSNEHSIRSVYNLDRLQKVSNGSILVGFDAFYTSILSHDGLLEYYRERKNSMYFGPTIGYSYTWIFGNNYFLNLYCILGLNVGVDFDNHYFFAPEILPKLSLGKHNGLWSMNFIVGCNYLPFLRNSYKDALFSGVANVNFSRRFL